MIVSIVKIAENPNNKDNWFDLVFNLIAFVPVAGDGLKIVFKQLRSGKSMGAILDAIPSKTLRGDVEKWFRNLNWNAYTKELQKTVNKMIDRLINVFDSWMTRAVLGQARLKTLVVQLRKMKTVANRQIEMVMKDLQLAHKKLWQPLILIPQRRLPSTKRVQSHLIELRRLIHSKRVRFLKIPVVIQRRQEARIHQPKEHQKAQ